MNRADYLAHPAAFAKRGKDLPHAKLNDGIVREIRATQGEITNGEWARRLGVHYRTIEKVRHYETWIHV